VKYLDDRHAPPLDMTMWPYARIRRGRTFGRNSNRANARRQERDHARDLGVRVGEGNAQCHPRERLKSEADAARRVHIQWHRQHGSPSASEGNLSDPRSTPMTSAGLPSMTSCRPTMPSAPPKRRCQ
jgi:hypothetical protein